MANREDNTLRIVLVGKTGSGKSATANSILGRRECYSRVACHTVTKSCQRAMQHWKGRNLLVVDTPGLTPIKETLQTTCEEISQCVLFSYPGPHAIILVLQLGLYTKVEQETVALIKALFGEPAMKHMIVLFTHKDDLGDLTLSEFIAASDVKLQSIIKECGNRCCAFNNNQGAEEAEKEAQVQELVELIEEMVQKNEGAYFSDAIYKDIDKKLKHLAEDLKIIYVKQLENAIKLIEEQCAQGKISQQKKKETIKFLNSEYDELVKHEREKGESNVFVNVINGIWKMLSNK